MELITLDELKRQMHYDPKTGLFTWLTDAKKGGFKAGRFAKSKDTYGYIQISINKKVYKGHRLAWFYMTGEWPKEQIDHINHVRDDNRFENLKECNNQINHRNRPKQRNNKSGTVGVRFYKNGWTAYIFDSGYQKYLGRFKTENEAIVVRKKAEIELGFNQNHGIGFGIQKPAKVKELERKSN